MARNAQVRQARDDPRARRNSQELALKFVDWLDAEDDFLTTGTVTAGGFKMGDDKTFIAGTDDDYSFGYNAANDEFRLVDGTDLTANIRLKLDSSGNFDLTAGNLTTTGNITTGDLYATGSVGVGTLSPSQELHVVRGAGALPGLGSQIGLFQNNALTSDNCIFGILAGTSGIAGLQFGDSGAIDKGRIYYYPSTDSLVFGTSRLARWTMDANGHLSATGAKNITTTGSVGVGTLSPSKSLHVVHGAGALPSLGNQIGLFQNNALTSDNCIFGILAGTSGIAGLQFGDSGSIFRGYLYYYHSTDSLVFGTSQTARWTMDANGHLSATGAKNITTTGDVACKDITATGSAQLGDLFVTGVTKLGDGGTTNYLEIKADGSTEQHGTARIDWQKKTAASVTLAAGTSASAASDLQTAHDGNAYTAVEVAATPGIDLTANFTGVTAFNWVQILARYNGSASHGITIQLEITPFDGSAWHTYGFFEDQPADQNYQNFSFFVPDDSAYLNSGTVKVRLVHEMGGTPSHELVVDVVALYQ